jgi:hypothetical protein
MVESAHASSIFALEYYASGGTAGKGFQDRISYDSKTNLLVVSSSGTLFDPDNPAHKPEHTNFQKALSVSEVNKIKQSVIQNNFFSIPPGENPSRLLDMHPDPHYYSLKITMDEQTHAVYWGDQGQSSTREEPKEVSNIEKVIREISSKEPRI